MSVQLALLAHEPPHEIPARSGRAEVNAVPARSILTPSSGYVRQYDFTLNPYSGCAFACDYCYARGFAPTPEREATWGEWVTVKENARALVAKACREGMLRDGHKVYVSSVTDPYQPIEHRLGLTRSVLEAILEAGVQPRLTVQTRSPIVARDADLLAQFTHVRVNLSITTDSEDVRLRYEPHAPAIHERLRTAERLVEAGVPIGICIAPMLPMVAPEAFGRSIARFRAAEYVSQPFHVGTGRRFSTNTPGSSFEKAREDGWTLERYRRTRDAVEAGLCAVLGPEWALLEGSEGFSPAGMERRQPPAGPSERARGGRARRPHAPATRQPPAPAGSRRA